MIELFAAAVAVTASGLVSWILARQRAGRRERERLSDPYQAAIDRYMVTGEQRDLDEALRHLPKGE